MIDGIVNTAKARILLNPKIDSEISDEIIYGMKFDILDKYINKWLKIRTEYNYIGYINRNTVVIKREESEKWINERNSIVISNFADILEEDKIQSKIIMTVPRGAYLIKTKNNNDNSMYTQVRLLDKRIGWVKTKFIRDIPQFPVAEETFRNNLVQDSKLYLNTQYRWGGKTPEGIDCSGLCSMVYMINGVNIYRDAIIKDGFPIKEIDIKNMKKGDLIYFPGHIAMYLGNNKYIHSSNDNNGVAINSLNKNDTDYLDKLANNIIYVGSIF